MQFVGARRSRHSRGVALAAAVLALAIGASTSPPVAPASSTTLCAAGDALADARQAATAKAEYVAVLKKHPDATCASDALRDPGITASLTAWSDGLLDLLLAVVAWVALVVAVIAVVLLVLAQFAGPRWKLVQYKCLDRLLAPRLTLQDLKDGGAPTGVGAGLTALVREHVTASANESSDATAYRLDRLTGKEEFHTAVGAVSAINPSFKAMAAVLGLVQWLLPRARLTASGALQVHGGRGEGAAIQLEGGRVPVASALWLGQQETAVSVAASAGADATPHNGSGFQPLAVPIGAWFDFEVRTALATPPPPGNACSYALLQGGLDAERREDDDTALRLYAAAIEADPDNVSAIVNRANLRARHRHEYDAAITDLRRAVMIMYFAP